MWETLLLLIVAGIAWLVFDAWRARDAAVAAARAACMRQGLQFLDDTVRRERSRLARDDQGRALIEHCFVFEFSDDRVTRRGGSVTMRRGEVAALELEPFLLG